MGHRSRTRRGDALVESVRKRARQDRPGAVVPSEPAVLASPTKTCKDVVPGTSVKLDKTIPMQHPLRPIFAGLVSVYAMMRRRNKQITYSSVKGAVEQASRRRFSMTDLHDLANIVPEIIVLERVGEDDVAMRMALGKGGAGAALEAFEENVARVGTSTAAPVATTPIITPSGLKAKHKRIRSVLQSPTSRRLSSLVSICEKNTATAAGNLATPMAAITENKELYDRTLSGVISLDSLHKLEKNEQEHVKLSSVEAKEARRRRAVISSLPDMLQRVMAVYGRKGPKVIELDAVCEKLRGGGLETVSVEDVRARVYCLAEHAPEFLRIEKTPRGIEEAWAVTKGLNFQGLMERLAKVAKLA
jgi:hypothetical protein